jgi:hypothetical protein
MFAPCSCTLHEGSYPTATHVLTMQHGVYKYRRHIDSITARFECIQELECMFAPCMRARAERSHPCMQLHCSPVRMLQCRLHCSHSHDPLPSLVTLLFFTPQYRSQWAPPSLLACARHMQHTLTASSCVNCVDPSKHARRITGIFNCPMLQHQPAHSPRHVHPLGVWLSLALKCQAMSLSLSHTHTPTYAHTHIRTHTHTHTHARTHAHQYSVSLACA